MNQLCIYGRVRESDRDGQMNRDRDGSRVRTRIEIMT
jgi:hypothetical protein